MSAAAANSRKHFFYDESLMKALSIGVKETLETMCGLSCEFTTSFAVKKWQPQGKVTGFVEMLSEQQQGLMLIHFSEAAALAIMEKLVGSKSHQVNEETLDCIGASVGIVYGRMKAIMNPKGYNFLMVRSKMSFTEKLTYPEGINNHLVFPFKLANSICYIQVIYYT